MPLWSFQLQGSTLLIPVSMPLRKQFLSLTSNNNFCLFFLEKNIYIKKKKKKKNLYCSF